MNDMLRSAAAIRTIGNPLNGFGISEYAILSLIAERRSIAIRKPTPAEKPYTTDVIKLYSLFMFKRATPRTAQFVVINGR